MTKKRRPPRKRAVNQSQIIEQLRRYRRLLNSTELGIDTMIKQLVSARARARKYSEKVSYYAERLDAQAAGADRALRAIQLDDPN